MIKIYGECSDGWFTYTIHADSFADLTPGTPYSRFDGARKDDIPYLEKQGYRAANLEEKLTLCSNGLDPFPLA